MPLLFSYGTLQLEHVQLETFGRLLKGEKDMLEGYKLTMIEITDAEVLRKSNQQFHPIISFSDDKNDQIEGVLYGLENDNFLLGDDQGLGKALSLDTLIYTPTGAKKMRDIQVGDKVFDENGNLSYHFFSS